MPITRTGKVKDGLTQYRVRVNYTDANGVYRRIEKLVYGKAEAREMEMELEESCSEANQNRRLTVSDLLDIYEDAQRHNVRETTLDKATSSIRGYVLPTLGRVRLDRLNSKQLIAWKNKIGDSDLALSTKQRHYKSFNALLNFAVTHDYLQQNPLKKIGNFKDVNNTESCPDLRYYTADEYLLYSRAARLIAEEKNTISEWSFYVFFSIAFYTGMRKGEINALRWSDIDERTIHVRHSIAQKLKGGDRESGTKNKSSIRSLQIPKPLLFILEEHRSRLTDANMYREDAYICGIDKPLRDTSIDYHNRINAKEAGVKRITIHEFRHTHASLLVNEGINIQEIARRLGHAKVEETWKTYAHLYPREEERALAVLDKIK